MLGTLQACTSKQAPAVRCAGQRGPSPRRGPCSTHGDGLGCSAAQVGLGAVGRSVVVVVAVLVVAAQNIIITCAPARAF